MVRQLSIVIPVYNEGTHILQTLSEIDRNITIANEVVVIYDFDEDNTLAALEPLLPNQDRIQPIRNAYGAGVLNAIKTGFAAANCDVVLVMMADLSDDLSAVQPMFDQIRAGCDVVCGSRYMHGGQQIGGPLIKRNLSRWAGLSLHRLFRFPIHDLTNSFKMYTRRVLEHITMESTGGFEIGMEILIKAHINGYRVCEVPTVWRDRDAGQSKFKLLKWIPKYAYWYVFAVSHLVRMRRNADA